MSNVTVSVSVSVFLVLVLVSDIVSKYVIFDTLKYVIFDTPNFKLPIYSSSSDDPVS